MITTVLWDVDATLLNFEASEVVSLKKLFEKYGVDINDELLVLYQKINRGYWLGLEEGRFDRHTVLTKRFDDFFDVLHLPRQDTDEMNDFYQQALGTYVIENKGAKDALEEIKARGFLSMWFLTAQSWLRKIN
jgi:2-haloacid dehalogenase